MTRASRPLKGFTLIELVIALTIIFIVMLLALPSFTSFRQRSALRSAAEQSLSFWNQARFEAAKRNQMVKVGVTSNSTGFCLGAATTTNEADTTPCDCSTATPAAGTECDVAVFPQDQSEWRGVTYYTASGATPTLGGGNAVAVIEPKQAGLATASQAGLISFAGPPGNKSYRLHMVVNSFGKAVLCESSTATAKMSDYLNRRCGP